MQRCVSISNRFQKVLQALEGAIHRQRAERVHVGTCPYNRDYADRQGFPNGLARSCREENGLVRPYCECSSSGIELVSSGEPNPDTDPVASLSSAVGRHKSAPAIMGKEDVAPMRFARCCERNGVDATPPTMPA